MAIKKDAPVQALVDPAVQAALGEQSADPVYSGIHRLQAARGMTPGKAKKRQRDRERSKVTFDWPQWLIERLEEMAGEEDNSFPINQLTAILVIEGLRAVAAGRLDIRARKIPTRTPKFDWFLRVDDETDL
jgi:hypothetical protein